VDVEVFVGGGQPRFQLVGLPDAAVREAKERVRAAIQSSGFSFPGRRVIVSLAPADVPKGGAAYDLPIALGVLVASKVVPEECANLVALGELALDGSLRPVRGGLGAAMVAARSNLKCLLPPASAAEAMVVSEVAVTAVGSLEEAIAVGTGASTGRQPEPTPPAGNQESAELGEVRGQLLARRALEIAAAGGHHLLMMGPPGGGKTMLARCLPTIMPRLDQDSIADVALAWAAAGLSRIDPAIPPFRSPHHSASLAALIGGGSGIPQPGEVALAHRGALFLDELGEFPVHLLDALRQPMEEGRVVVARKGSSVEFKTEFQLVAATNPCPCGYEGDNLCPCTCPPGALARYRRRLSGPLLDRFDMRIRVPRVEPTAMSGHPGETSAAVLERVVNARRRQGDRKCLNSRLTRGSLDARTWGAGVGSVLESAMSGSRLTARGWDRVRRVAITIADLVGAEVVETEHVMEALAYRGAV
jgi:magnesium chelatase family protein